MSKTRDIQRLELILDKINLIDEIISVYKYTSKALEDEVMGRPAILMHLISIAEQFLKLQTKEILNKFDDSDVKGAIATRNFIAHDYDGVNLSVIEIIIKERLPKIKEVIVTHNFSD